MPGQSSSASSLRRAFLGTVLIAGFCWPSLAPAAPKEAAALLLAQPPSSGEIDALLAWRRASRAELMGLLLESQRSGTAGPRALSQLRDQLVDLRATSASMLQRNLISSEELLLLLRLGAQLETGDGAATIGEYRESLETAGAAFDERLVQLAARPRRRPELRGLADELVRLDATPGAEAERDELRRRLLELGYASEGELAPDRLRRRRAGQLAEELAHRSGARRDEYLENARSHGYTDRELGLVPLQPALGTAKALEVLLSSAPREQRRRAAAELRKQELTSERVAAIRRALDTAEPDSLPLLLAALSASADDPTLAAIWSLRRSADAGDRQMLEMGLVNADLAGSYDGRIAQELEQGLIDRDQGVKLLRRMAGRPTQIPSGRSALLSLAQSEGTAVELQEAAVRYFKLRPTDDEADSLLALLRNPTRDVSVRLAARRVLRANATLRLGDDVELALLRSDPSADLRRAMLREVDAIGQYPGDEELRAAAEVARKAIGSAK